LRDFLLKAKALVRQRASVITIVLAVTFAGLAAGYTTVTAATSTTDFCGHACHEMERTVYTEYLTSKHHTNVTGTVVSCAQCHLPPKGEQPATIIHQVAALSRVWGHFVDREYLPGRFEARRAELAKNVRQGFARTNARECKACHAYADMILTKETETARRDHTASMKTNANCLECHKGLAHQRMDQPASYDFP
jgi:nitrate/TMAO reductase-like tetraheme cytochrome c subunit